MFKEEIIKLNNELKRIKELNYISDTRNNRAGLEKTLYDLVSPHLKTEYKTIALKVKTNWTSNYLTIFNATPEGKESNQIKRLRDKYGEPESFDSRRKVFNNSIQANYSKFINGKLFKLSVNYSKSKIFLEIFNKDYVLVDCKSYWNFKTLEASYNKRAKYLFLVRAWEKKENKTRMYKYYDYSLYKLVDFKEFLNLIEEGVVRVTFRVNIFKKGPKEGKICDKGTSFEIQELDLNKLYKKVEI